jgi:hypothetical protein
MDILEKSDPLAGLLCFNQTNEDGGDDNHGCTNSFFCTGLETIRRYVCKVREEGLLEECREKGATGRKPTEKLSVEEKLRSNF